METNPRYTFGREERLKSRDAIKSLFSGGNSFNLFPVKVFWRHSGLPGLRAGIGVSSSLFRKANQRNRIKRLMRECFRLQKNKLRERLETSGRGMELFLVYRGNVVPEYDHLYTQVGTVLQRLLKILDEESKQNT